jgi:hypothetical protein
MSYTVDQFKAAALDAVSQYPGVAQLARVGDPTVLAQIHAQAAMLAMLSAQVDVARFEPFAKTLDSTVLADAALRGILPLARAATVTIDVTNNGIAAYPVTLGRRFLDSKGRIYTVTAAATVAAGSVGRVTCVQQSARVMTHVVTSPGPFYAFEVDQSDDPVFLYSLSMRRIAPGSPTAFTYNPDWFDTSIATSFNVEVDERRRLSVRFGSTGVVGYQPVTGDTFEVTLTECSGVVDDIAAGADFSLEYILTTADGLTTAKLVAVVDTGAEPPSIADLRVMSRFPAIYDHNAVYLGEFALLLRRYITPRFLSVWNEQVEEAVRGASVDSINTLFVSGLVAGMTDATFRTRAANLIGRADSSYRVQFVAAVLVPVPITVTARVGTIYDKAAVSAQIRTLLLQSFGDGAAAVSEGQSNPIRTQAVSKILRDGVPALGDEQADFSVSITPPTTQLPENFVILTDASITVTVDYAEYNAGLWSR